MVACNKSSENTKDTKCKTTDDDFADAKSQFAYVTSSKTRAELEIALDGKAVGAPITKEEVGYTEPKNLPNGVAIDSAKYTLEELMAAHAKTFKIKVTLKKGTKESTKVITIIAKTYDFTTIKGLFKDNAVSSKTKTELRTTETGIGGITKDNLVTKEQMGYTEPPTSLLDGVVVTYKLKQILENATTSKTFKVLVLLTKGTGTTAEVNKDKVISIAAMPDAPTTPSGSGSK